MKVDLKKQIPTYAAPYGRFEIVTVPPVRYLAIDGAGDPNTSQTYADALATLYPVAYALKFLSKRELDRDYVVMPLEALWWADDMAAFTAARDKRRWRWTAMIMVPEGIDDAHVDLAMQTVRAKGIAPALTALRVDVLDEGLCVQTLHIGPYDAEGPLLEAMHAEFIPEQGLRMTGRHHEIYLSDPRRAAPEKLRTILRQPVERVESNVGARAGVEN
ncbi:MAG: GyrI-like domain-containing protein [Microbacterium sp.]|uniref:GyrI-like domain-containing protein n=1 Tax=Microbacterium sp. TaxID=51671 RepID=UPI002727815D|nr:GyrI-like domain-containing protein [Microbacterium sp.]MDO8383809.1 GyrI-like domain-containing protein [Microbacterium sp.]